MRYFNREMLLDTFTTEDSDERRKLMASVDKNQVGITLGISNLLTQSNVTL